MREISPQRRHLGQDRAILAPSRALYAVHLSDAIIETRAAQSAFRRGNPVHDGANRCRWQRGLAKLLIVIAKSSNCYF